jgi:hypothetical protein
LIVLNVCPPPRGRTVAFQVPQIESAADIPVAILKVIEAMFVGELTPDEAASVTSIFDALRQSFEVATLAADVERPKVQVGLTEARQAA